jgi:hypothetical protein
LKGRNSPGGRLKPPPLGIDSLLTEKTRGYQNKSEGRES